MEKRFQDYIQNGTILDELLDVDFSDLSFAYDYNEVQEQFFDENQNNYVFLVGECGLRKKDMLGRIYSDLIESGISKNEVLYLDYELPFMRDESVSDIVDTFQFSNTESKFTYLIINEIQEISNWFEFVVYLHKKYSGMKLICSSSTPPYIYEKLFDEKCKFCKVVVLSKKNSSNIKYESDCFGTYKEFKYNQKNGIIEIKGLTREGKTMSSHIIPSSINGLPVKVIASGAFHDRHELLSIEIPETVEMIGDYAFSKCVNIQEISFPDGLKYIGDHAFLGDKSLETIHGGQSVEHIGNSAFYATAWFKNQNDYVVIGKTLYKYLGNEKDLILPSNITVLSSYSFANSHIQSVSSKQAIIVYEGAFYCCDCLQTVDINMDYIPAFCFYQCSKLQTKFSVKTVGKFAFYGCTSIEQSNAEIIESCAFTNCINLCTVNNIKTVGNGAFWRCSSLKAIDLEKTVSIGRFAFAKSGLQNINFCGEKLGDYSFFDISNLKSVNISQVNESGCAVFYKSNSIKNISISGKYPLKNYFAGNTPQIEHLTVYGDITDNFCRDNPYLKTIKIYGAKKFGRWSFYNCKSLQSVVLEDVDRIGAWAFAYCDNLTDIILPASVSYIEMNAFRYCHNLRNIRMLSQALVLFGANAFYSTATNIKFFVNKCLIPEYRESALWSEYYNFIEKID